MSKKIKNKKKNSNPIFENKVLVLVVAAFLVGGFWNYFFDIDFDIKLDPRITGITEIQDKQKGSKDVPDNPDAERLASIVVPEEGYTVDVNWGDTGKKLVAAGGIDIDKYKENYKGEVYEELLTYLTENKDEGITINRQNAYFWVNTLWALGLTQKSDVLDKGVMGTQYKDRIGNFASTGGWTLGAKDAVSLYSSSNIISLTAEQQKLVDDVSKNIYRPCCGNPTSFPDCNHGMAILGLLELMASQGATDEEMYEASLAFNSYWFTQTYMDLAYYFEKEEGRKWSDVDSKKLLSAKFSSAPGYQAIKEQIGDTPRLQSSGGSCGA